MKKIAVFVEGQNELIFVRHLLFVLIDPSVLEFKCMRLYSESLQEAPYHYKPDNPRVYFQIINVGNDEKVLGAIRERVDGLINLGFSKVIGLRDMYSYAYRKTSKGKINAALSQRFIEEAQKSIAAMNAKNIICFHFAIMELEAWILSMYNLFIKVDPKLTVSFIEKALGYNLSQIDPQSHFFHPARELNRVLQLIGQSYKKSQADSEKISSKITKTDIEDACDKGRCQAFQAFCNDIVVS